MKSMEEYISRWESDVEQVLPCVHNTNLKAVLSHSGEVLQALKKEGALLPNAGEQMTEDTPEQAAAAALSREIAERTLEAGRMIRALPDDAPEKILLQKLVAAGDQTVYGLRKFL